MKHIKNITISIITLMLSFKVSAESIATQGSWLKKLQGRDFNGDAIADAYYDLDLDITWLADANASAGSDYDAPTFETPDGIKGDGAMNLRSARSWAANLDVYGITGWRLPWATMESWCDQGTPCGRQEMAHLAQYTLGNARGLPFNTGPFKGVPPGGPTARFPEGPWYWGETIPSTEWYAWYINLRIASSGVTGNAYEDELYVWAVRDGDVGTPIASSVPEPTVASSFFASIFTLLALRRRKIFIA